MTHSTAKYLDQETKDARDEEKKAHELQQPEDESEFAFEIGSAALHVTHSINTVASYSAPGIFPDDIPPDFKKAIGVTTEGGKFDIAGVDIDNGALSFSRKVVFPAAAVTLAYIDFLFRLRRKTNASTWKGFAAGEVRFVGASGRKRKDGNFDITFRFEASPNIENQTIGDITGINKGGWEYLWIYSMPRLDAASKTLIPTPVAAYTEQVYEDDGNYAAIGLGS